MLKSEKGCGVRFPTIGQTWSSGDIKAGFKSQLLLYLGGNAKKEIALDYLDDDQTNKELTNLRVLCYCCYYILKMDRLDVDVPANVKSFQKAIYNAFNRSSES